VGKGGGKGVIVEDRVSIRLWKVSPPIGRLIPINSIRVSKRGDYYLL